MDPLPRDPSRIDPADRPNRVPWPPILYAGLAVLAYGLERALPLPAPPESLLARWVGAVLVLSGIAVAVAAMTRFRAHDTPIDPTGRPRALATDGIYHSTRNPMYLGALVFFLGLGLLLRSVWLILLLPAMALLLTRLAIVREEAYLERRFGDEYRRYKARTRRWV